MTPRIGEAVDNPVLRLYDGCVLRNKGEYYAMGTGRHGKIFR